MHFFQNRQTAFRWIAPVTQIDRVLYARTDGLNPVKLMAGRFDYWAASRQRSALSTAAAGLTEKAAPVLSLSHSDLRLRCHRETPDELVRKLAQALTDMRADGTAERIVARYAHWSPEGQRHNCDPQWLTGRRQ